jgi:hemoglobin
MTEQRTNLVSEGVDPRSPYALVGGEARVHEIVRRFYDHMAREESALARLHPCDDEGRVAQESQDRFALFLVGWLGGPQTYMERHGHPRLRMRHGRVPVNAAMRDAWLRSMRVALDECGVNGEVRTFLDQKFADLADFLRNVPG